MAVYDDEKTTDNQLREITGISNDEEKKIDERSAHSVKQNLNNSESNSATSSNSGTGSNVSLSADQLGTAEAGQDSNSASTGFYNNKDDTSTRGKIKNIFWGNRRRKQVTVGGSVTGLVVGGTLMGATLFGGTGFEFIHIAQLLQKFHFSNAQSQQDNQFSKLIRYAKNIPNGTVERTRLGYLGNKFADFYETKLNESGLVSTYTKRFGLFDGYMIDKNSAEFKGLTDEQIQSKFESETGLTLTKGSEAGKGNAFAADDLVLDASSLKFRQTFLLNYQLLRQANLNKLSAAIGARLMCQRAGCNWHPLSSLKGTYLERPAEAKALQKTDEQEEQTGETLTVEDTAKSPANSDPNQTTDTNNLNAANGDLSQVSTEAQAANQSDSALNALNADIGKKLALGGAAAVGILCTLKTIDGQVNQIKQTQVVLPLIRMGVQAIAIGNQVMSGKDVDANELSALGSQLYGKDAEGKYTDWSASESIQANLGNSNSGVPPNGTLTSIQQGSPFAIVNSIPGIGAVCSTVGQILSGVVSIAIDATGIGGIVAGAISGAVIGVISDQAAHWLAGKAVDTAAVGADFGNEIDFGSALAANQQQLAAGGTSLTPTQASALQTENNIASNQEFQQNNLSYKLFALDDPRSLISTVFGSSKTTFSGNFDSMVSRIMNVGSTLARLPELLFKGAAAQSTTNGYNYPFPTYAFSESDIDNPAVQNGYTNADYVANKLLDTKAQTTDGTNKTYIDKASDCFGVTIDPGADPNNPVWNVKINNNQSLVNPYVSSYSGLDCNEQAPSDCTNNTSDACNWLRIRFFIQDTEVMNSMGCYAGDDQACLDIGMPTGGGSSQTGMSSFGHNVYAYQNIGKSVTNLLNPSSITTQISEIFKKW